MPRPKKRHSPFRYFNSSPQVIRLVVMMYVRFPLSLRNVEDLLAEMVDLLASSPDFTPPAKGSGAVWFQLEAEGGGGAELVIARPMADGELWVVAPMNGRVDRRDSNRV